MKKISSILRNTLAVGAGAVLASQSLQAKESVKVGVLHSLSGTMAISETSLRDAHYPRITISNVRYVDYALV